MRISDWSSDVCSSDLLDNLDYWVAQLKKNGIYVNFNLNVGRRFKAGDGVPDADLLGPAKGFTYIGPELIALHKDYAKKLLGHTNRYTGLRYDEDRKSVVTERRVSVRLILGGCRNIKKKKI